MVFCDIHCSVALPYGAVGWSALSDCGISAHTHLLVVRANNMPYYHMTSRLGAILQHF